MLLRSAAAGLVPVVTTERSRMERGIIALNYCRRSGRQRALARRSGARRQTGLLMAARMRWVGYDINNDRRLASAHVLPPRCFVGHKWCFSAVDMRIMRVLWARETFVNSCPTTT